MYAFVIVQKTQTKKVQIFTYQESCTTVAHMWPYNKWPPNSSTQRIHIPIFHRLWANVPKDKVCGPNQNVVPKVSCGESGNWSKTLWSFPRWDHNMLSWQEQIYIWASSFLWAKVRQTGILVNVVKSPGLQGYFWMVVAENFKRIFLKKKKLEKKFNSIYLFHDYS